MTQQAQVTASRVARVEQIPLGMAQLAVQGLSEDWWLKHLGDVHWRLIADSVAQHTTVFRDRHGRQIYAAFCATEFDQPCPQEAALGEMVQVQSELWAAGRSRIQSEHRILLRGCEIARFRLLSTFVVHQDRAVNASVARATPYLIPLLQDAPDGFAHSTSALAKALRGRARRGPSVALTPSVGRDFNAVGLLYFPSYTRLFDEGAALLDPDAGWSPVRNRLVCYFSNVEAGDTVELSQNAATGPQRELMLGQPGGQTIGICQISRFEP